MAKAIPTEELASHTLAGLMSDPVPKVMHGSKSVSGIFKGRPVPKKPLPKCAWISTGWNRPANP